MDQAHFDQEIQQIGEKLHQAKSAIDRQDAGTALRLLVTAEKELSLFAKRVMLMENPAYDDAVTLVVADISELAHRLKELNVRKSRRQGGRLILVDIEQRAGESPGTFRILPEEDRRGLQRGMHAKLIFENPDGSGERMWVKVTKVTSPGRYEGILASNPIVVDMKYGDVVRFEKQHVADVY